MRDERERERERERESNLKVRKLMKGKIPGTQGMQHKKDLCTHIQIMFPDSNSWNRTVTEPSSARTHPIPGTSGCTRLIHMPPSMHVHL